MGVVFTNNAETTLAAAITSTSATSISVTSSSTFPAIQAGEHFYATLDDGTNNEIVKVTGVSGTTWTVVRASDSTTARTFANGITVQLRATAALLTDIQENIAAKSANQTVYNATAASNATAYDVGVNPGVEANAMVFLDGVMQHHDTFSFSGSTLTFDAAPTNGTKIEVIVDNLINLQSSNLTTDTFTATSGQTAFTLSDAPAAENNLIVFIDGVFQDQGTYSISNHTLTLATGAVVGRTVTVYIINPVNIGTPSNGTVTSAKLSGNITMPGTLTVGAFDVAFDSPTFVVDNANSRVGLGTATPSVPVDIVGEVKISSHLNMPDNAKAIFGAGSDLEIYHDGSNSYIKDVGTGNLWIGGVNVHLGNPTASEYYIQTISNGAVTLYYDNSPKLATTATGIDVTGTATMDGLTVNSGTADTVATFQSTDQFSDLALTDSGGTSYIRQSNGSLILEADRDNASAGSVAAIKVDNTQVARFASGGDISFYEDTGTTAKLFWDASAESLGIGTSSPSEKLDVNGNIKIPTTSYIDIGSAAGNNTLYLGKTSSSSGSIARQLQIRGRYSSGDRTLTLTAGGSTTNAIIDASSDLILQSSSGNVGIGTSSPESKLAVKGSSGDADLFSISDTTVPTSGVEYGTAMIKTNSTEYALNITSYNASGKGLRVYNNGGQNAFLISQAGGDRFVVDGSGNVGIGTTSIDGDSILHLKSNTPNIFFEDTNDNQDWRLEATSVFKLQDVTRGAEVFRFNSSGELLVGTTTSEAKLTVSGDASAGQFTALALKQDSSSDDQGSSMTCDLDFYLWDNNTRISTPQARIGITGDGTANQNYEAGGQLCFYTNIRNWVSPNLTERMRIDSLGNLLVGKTDTTVGNDGQILKPNGETFHTIASANNTLHVYSSTASAYRFYVSHAGQIHATSTSITAISDERLKENIVDLETGLSEVMSLQPRRFDWKNGDGENVAGFIAQEVETVLPDLISDYKHENLDDAKSVRMGDMIPTLVKAIQEQQEQIETLKQEIREIKDNG